jgi:hypothetical protein
MKNNKILVPHLLALAISQLFLGNSAWADSALGPDTVLSNTLAPRGLMSSGNRDERGKSLISPELNRTPGGLMYGYPYEPPVYVPLSDDWNARFTTELGVLHTDGPVASAKFNERRDWSNGFLLNSFNLGLENEKTARYLEVAGGGVTRNDQYLQAKYGRYGDYKIRTYFNELEQPFGGDAQTFYDGAGSGNLTLRPGFGLVPGGAGSANTAAAKATDALNLQRALQHVDLGLTRKKAGLEMESNLGNDASVFMRYGQERREGTRPFGGAMGFVFGMTPAGGGATNTPGGSLVETIEPIDYRTHDLLASVRWARDDTQANLTYTGSFFRNNIDTLTWENPFSSANGPGILKYGRTDLAPDNDFHNLKLDFGASALPMRGQINGTLSIGRMTQNDDYIAPMVNSGNLVSTPISSTSTPLANPTPFTSQGVALASPVLNADLWNTTDALSQKSSNARIGTWLGQLGGSIQPSDDLTLRGKLRRYAEDNKTSYTAYNPLTGQYGYVALDGGLWVNSKGYSGIYSDQTGTIASPSGNIDVLRSVFPIRYRSIPFEYRKDNYNLDGDYRLARRTTLSLGYEREEYTRAHRERDKTWEDRFRVAINNRDLDWATVRLSYEYGNRKGSAYNSDPYEPFIMSPDAPLPSTQGGNSGNLMAIPPHTLADLRKFDLSDRKQHIVNARINFMLRQDMDLMLSGKVLENGYAADYGRSIERSSSVNADWSWSMGPRAGAYAHYSFQRSRQHQANINDAASGPYNLGNEDASAGGANYPLANAWSQLYSDDSHSVGLGARYGFGKAMLETNFTMVYSRTSNSYTYASPGALTNPTNPAFVALAGSGMDDSIYRQNILETSLTYQVRKNMAWRIFHRYEKAKFVDWHYDGLQNVYNNAAFLGAGPQSYSANTVGIFFQYTLDQN